MKRTLLDITNDFQTQYNLIAWEYLGDNGIFSNDGKMLTSLKRLPEQDQKIMILYAELKSIRKVAKILGRSASYMCRRIKEIRSEILYLYSAQ